VACWMITQFFAGQRSLSAVFNLQGPAEYSSVVLVPPFLLCSLSPPPSLLFMGFIWFLNGEYQLVIIAFQVVLKLLL